MSRVFFSRVGIFALSISAMVIGNLSSASATAGTTDRVMASSNVTSRAPFFGTLATDPTHAQTEAGSGVKVAMLELQWKLYEPNEGQFDAAYIAQVRARLNGLRQAGMRITLALGLHLPPAWALAMPNATFRDQYGNASSEINLVFNQSLRDQAKLYFARVAQDLGIASIWAIRLTSGGDAEVLYPGGGSYWAFDSNAQNGASMPPSMSRNPYPGWKPGMATLTTQQVSQWADWYIKALDNTVDWQMQTFTRLGFGGYYQVLTPGSGTRPEGFASDVQRNLPDGVTGVGAVWDRFYEYLPDKRRVVAYVSSMADRSGGDDSCQANDATTSLDSPSADSWSATRWISRIANAWGLPVAGENPGWNQPVSMNAHYVDTSSAGMLSAAIRQLISCHMQGMYWAHDDKIWDNTMPLSRYSAAIRAVDPSGGVAPSWPNGT